MKRITGMGFSCSMLAASTDRVTGDEFKGREDQDARVARSIFLKNFSTGPEITDFAPDRRADDQFFSILR
jgi:hypothetical protein